MDLSFHSSFAWNYNMFTLDIHLLGCVLETETANLRLPKTEKLVAHTCRQLQILRTFVIGCAASVCDALGPQGEEIHSI